MNAFLRRLPGPASPSSAASLIVLPLAAVGAASAAALIGACISSAVRRLVDLSDPIVPSEESVLASLRDDPLTMAEEVESFIREDDDAPVVLGAERTVVWVDEYAKAKTEYAVVYLHGWGACRQECRPVSERIAAALGANLYCARLPGHGRRHRRGRLGGGGPDGEALVEEATPAELVQTAVDAVRVGLAIGERLVLIGMSTGGVLATWVASLPSLRPKLAGTVLISPAYALGHPMYPILKHTFSTLRLLPSGLGRTFRTWLINAVLGPTKIARARNVEHQRYNALVYPSVAILNLLDVLWSLEDIDHSSVLVPTILFGNPQDRVANFRVEAANAFLRFGEVPKALHCVTRSEHPHVIASEALSPSTVDEISEAAILFIRTHVSGGGGLAKDVRPPPSVDDRWQSAQSGMGSFASTASLKDITRPFEA